MQNREIKFRVWGFRGMIEPDFIYLPELKAFEGARDVEDWTTCGTKLMQYTDRKDKNGKEIFEDDVILRNGEKYTVIWNGDGYIGQRLEAFHVPEGSLFYTNGEPEFKRHLCDLANCEVIGNIYENPELLTTQSHADH